MNRDCSTPLSLPTKEKRIDRFEKVVKIDLFFLRSVLGFNSLIVRWERSVLGFVYALARTENGCVALFFFPTG